MDVDFNIHIRYTFQLFGQQFAITDTVVNTWIIMAVLIAIAILIRIKLNKFEEIPTGAQSFIESAVELFDNFVTSTMGEKYNYFGNWFFGVFMFVLSANLSGLFTLRPPTADLATTLTLALCTVSIMHFMSIKTQGIVSYLKGYLDPFPIFLPMNIVSEFATPVSLSFRMFGNLLGGTIIMGMVYALPIYVKIGIPAVLHAYFDVFSGCMQAFVFTILSMTFIRDKIAD